ncbi:glycoside hydrolase [Aspergillus ellipticus CBS 707.79]|uniref:Probable beta-glucosidase btgE n=1 Tax=Aspergillus ellipticus CBS 707.79 TaxID=1448320 RepID=A0A319DJY7_9EURO|nr:glycoside hydrolase [Aspergillus ellipticus CBS 707.79]
MRGAFLATAAAALAGTALADGAHMRRHGHDSLHHNRAVQAGGDDSTCTCSTEVVTVWGSPTLVPVPTTSTIVSEVVTTLHSTAYTTVTVVASESASTEAAATTPEGVAATGVTGATGGAAGSAAPSESSTPAEAAGATGGAAGGVGEATTTVSATPVAAATTSSTEAVPTPETTTFASTGVYTIPASTITVSVPTTVVAATTTSLASGTQTYGGVTTIVETSTTVTCPYATVSPSGSTVTSILKTTTYVCPAAGTYTIAPTTTYVPSNTVVTYPTPSTVTPGVYSHTAEVVTVTVTDYTYTCPFANAASTTSVVAATSAVSVPAVTTTVAPAVTTAAAAVTTTVEAPTTSAEAATTSVAAATTVEAATSSVQSSAVSSSSSSAAAASSGVSASGNSMGMTYTPYTNSGGCKSESTVDSDISIIAAKGFTHIRLYSTDCSTLEYVGTAAAKYGLKLILGVYISSTGTSGAADQVTAIKEWADWSLVTLIVVGNEAISDGYTTAAELATFISSSKATFEAAGYTGEVTTTEPIDIWQSYGTSNLCTVVDVVGANIHPFFNAQTTAAEAGTFAESEVKLLKEICTGKTVINLETGWPSKGNANGAAVPGTSEQATAIKGIRESVGELSVFFSYANDLWKDPGEFDVEQYWGCIDQF